MEMQGITAGERSPLEAGSGASRLWSAPRLTCFGSVDDLTASGSRGIRESGLGNIYCWINPGDPNCKTRRP